MSTLLRIELNKHLYLRNPTDTEMGRRMLTSSVELMDELGFEQFTFKKLANRMGSTEATLYRYFENKHRLLNYLVSWYWAWMRFQVGYVLTRVHEPAERLRLILDVLTGLNRTTPAVAELDDTALARIVIYEGSKSYLTHEVDEDNRVGLFQEYKALVKDISGVVLDINPHYAYPAALVSTLVETARKQLFFADHLPSLTEASHAESGPAKVRDFMYQLLMRTLTLADPESISTT